MSKASMRVLVWSEGEEPRGIYARQLAGPSTLLTPNTELLNALTLKNIRPPAALSESMIEAIANHDVNFAEHVIQGKKLKTTDYPNIEEGVRAMALKV